MNLFLLDDGGPEGFFAAHDARAVHLRKVLSARPGDSFAAGVLGGALGRLTVLSVSREGTAFRFTEEAPPLPLLPLEIIIGAARPLVTRRLLKDLSSLGLKALHFVAARLSEKSYLESSLWKNGEYKDCMKEGLVQSGNTLLPEARLYKQLEDCIAALTPAAPENTGETAPEILRCVFDPSGELSLAHLARPAHGAPPAGMILAVGPERGWTQNELESFIKAGFRVYSMGKRILRTEAAALAASVAALSRMGFM
jgi:RsmE family RNA methyltransferase